MSVKKVNTGKTINYDFDFLKNVKTSSGISINKNKVVASPCFKEFVSYNVNESAFPRHFYVIRDRVFAFTNYCKIGEYKDLIVKEKSLRSYDAIPHVLEIYDGGVSRILVAQNEIGEILGERNIEFSYSIGNFLTYINKRFFFTIGQKIWFTEEFDYLSEVENQEPTNFIQLDDDLGDVQGMYPIGQKLIVVCKHGIEVLTLSPNPSGYKLSRINVKELEVIPNSVVTHGNHVYFLATLIFVFLTEQRLIFIQYLKKA